LLNGQEQSRLSQSDEIGHFWSFGLPMGNTMDFHWGICPKYAYLDV